MKRSNHGASNQTVREKMWKHAQRQTNKDGKPRIPLQPHISKDVESQVALRRGVAAEKYRYKRDQSRYQEWEKNRSRTQLTNHSKLSDQWEEVPYRRRKTSTKFYKPQPIQLERRYDTLHEDSEWEEMQSYEAVQSSLWDIHTLRGTYNSCKFSNGSVMSKWRED